MNINLNDLEKNIEYDNENLEDGMDTEKKIFDENDKVKNENFNKESFDYKKEITNLDNKIRFDNSSKLNNI